MCRNVTSVIFRSIVAKLEFFEEWGEYCCTVCASTHHCVVYTVVLYIQLCCVSSCVVYPVVLCVQLCCVCLLVCGGRRGEVRVKMRREGGE